MHNNHNSIRCLGCKNADGRYFGASVGRPLFSQAGLALGLEARRRSEMVDPPGPGPAMATGGGAPLNNFWCVSAASTLFFFRPPAAPGSRLRIGASAAVCCRLQLFLVR